jgi:hypothetical protein
MQASEGGGLSGMISAIGSSVRPDSAKGIDVAIFLGVFQGGQLVDS